MEKNYIEHINLSWVGYIPKLPQLLTVGSLTNGAAFIRIVTRGGSLATQTVSTVTFNGVSCSLIRADNYSDVDAGRLRTEIWGVAVGTLAAGSYNAVVTWGGTITRGVVEVSSYVGVDQTNITEATGGGNAIGQASPISNSVTTATANAYLIDCVYSKTGGALTVGSNQTQDANVGVNAGGDQVAMSREGPVATPASTAMSWTYVTTDDYCQSIAVIKPATTNIALTKIRSDYITDNGTELWYLVAPATGANNIVVTMTAVVDGLFGAGMSFTGVDQSNPIDANAGTTTTGTSISQNITTVAADAMIVNIVHHYASTVVLTPDADQTERFNTPTTGDNDQAGGTRLVTTATSYTTSWTADASDGMTLSIASLKPYVAPAGSTWPGYINGGSGWF